MNIGEHLKRVWEHTLMLVAPTPCVGCKLPGRLICARCSHELAGYPKKCFVAQMPVWSFWRYDTVARNVLIAYKQKRRMDVLFLLSEALSQLAFATTQERLEAAPLDARIHVVVIPSSRKALRMRGFHPIELILSEVPELAHPTANALALNRQPKNNKHLSRAERQQNRRGSFRADERLTGQSCLIVDDILTSGATLIEAKRALESVGGIVVGALVLADRAKPSSTMFSG